MQLQASYRDVRHWEELIYFIEQNCSPHETYCQIAIYKCNLTKAELDKGQMELYAPGQTMNNCQSGQISYNNSISNTFKLKLGHNVKLFLVEMKAATGQDIAEHVIRLVKVIPTSIFPVSYTPLLICILRLRREPMRMKQWAIRRQVGKRLIM
jgi:hypothetical protein